MYLGRIVERAGRRALYGSPLHPYTIALLAADPAKDPAKRNRRAAVRLRGDAPSPLDPPPGCRFHTRCPYAQERCRTEVPALREAVPDHWVACHFVTSDGARASPPQAKAIATETATSSGATA